MEEKQPNSPQNSGKATGTKNPEVSLQVKPLSLDEKLDAFDPAKHGGEFMVAEPVGLEVIPR